MEMIHFSKVWLSTDPVMWVVTTDGSEKKVEKDIAK